MINVLTYGRCSRTSVRVVCKKHSVSYSVDELPVETLHLSIPLWVVWRGSCLPDAEQVAHLHHDNSSNERP
ncbi:hypothetical protein T07_5587 [Trichinella nelsoni]|uniref:Uncharacterized protein n=1 Tax=Trichinella nelsoni TaxID=6336 RepID=A0A0V0SKV0_9BILA|nr:hypothetical protein T07_5587 [Trichinella nelsoni]